MKNLVNEELHAILLEPNNNKAFQAAIKTF